MEARICDRRFPRILVAEFHIRRSHSKTCTEDGKQIEGENK